MVAHDVVAQNFLRDAAVFKFTDQNGVQNLFNKDLLLLLGFKDREHLIKQKVSLVVLKAKVNAATYHLWVLFLLKSGPRHN